MAVLTDYCMACGRPGYYDPDYWDDERSGRWVHTTEHSHAFVPASPSPTRDVWPWWKLVIAVVCCVLCLMVGYHLGHHDALDPRNNYLEPKEQTNDGFP